MMGQTVEQATRIAKHALEDAFECDPDCSDKSVRATIQLLQSGMSVSEVIDFVESL